MLRDWDHTAEYSPLLPCSVYVTPRKALFTDTSSSSKDEVESPLIPEPGSYTYDLEAMWTHHMEAQFEHLTHDALANDQEKVVLTPEGLLPAALRHGSPELNFPPLDPLAKKRRISGKTFRPNEILAELQNNASYVIPQKFDWQGRVSGRDAFHRFYVIASGVAWRDCNQVVKDLWRTVPRDMAQRWAFVAQLWKLLYVVDDAKNQFKKRIPLPDGSTYDESVHARKQALESEGTTINAFGCLLTYHTKFGLDKQHVQQGDKQTDASENLIKYFQSSSENQELFSTFRMFVASLAETFKFKNYACCLEHCTNSPQKYRVHLHAFLGQQVGYNVWHQTSEKASMKRTHLIFKNVVPNIQLMRVRGANGMQNATATGMYYCSSPKIGQIFTFETAKPFEDLLAGI